MEDAILQYADFVVCFVTGVILNIAYGSSVFCDVFIRECGIVKSRTLSAN